VPETPSHIFKFVSLRPPTPPSVDAASRNFTADDRPAKTTPVARLIAQFTAENASTIPERVKKFIADEQYDLSYPQSAGYDLLDVSLTAARALPHDTISTARVTEAIESATRQQIAALYNSDAARKVREGLWDRYYAFYLLSAFVGQDLSTLTNNLRIYHLLGFLSREQAIPDHTALSDILNARPLVDSIFVSLPKPKVELPKPPSDSLPPAREAEFKALWSDLVDTHRALEAVRALPFTTPT
jgi:hypothetical protein